MNIPLSKLEPTATKLAAEALEILGKSGNTEDGLKQIGNRLAAFAASMPAFVSDEEEVVIGTETDGTFELTVKLLRVEDRHVPESYDTWSVYAPSVGDVSVEIEGQDVSEISVGQSVGIKAGVKAAFNAVGTDSQLCCLFGVSRRYIAPPRR